MDLVRKCVGVSFLCLYLFALWCDNSCERWPPSPDTTVSPLRGLMGESASTMGQTGVLHCSLQLSPSLELVVRCLCVRRSRPPPYHFQFVLLRSSCIHFSLQPNDTTNVSMCRVLIMGTLRFEGVIATREGKIRNKVAQSCIQAVDHLIRTMKSVRRVVRLVL